MLAQLIGLAGSMYAAKKNADAMKRAGDAQRQAGEAAYADARLAAQPLLEAQGFALPRLRAAVGQMGAQANGESATLRAAHGINLTNIGRQTAGSIAKSQQFFGSSGNMGRARGETLRAQQTGTELANTENLGYAAGQDAYKAGNMAQYLQGLGNLAQIGGQGNNLLMAGINARTGATTQGAETRAAGQNGLYSDLASIGGDIAGGTYNKSYINARNDAFKLLFSGNSPITTPPVGTTLGGNGGGTATTPTNRSELWKMLMGGGKRR